jgi:alkyl sulfatase BDS1-like metallo-beta-lactamase superfamily hydrolase
LSGFAPERGGSPIDIPEIPFEGRAMNCHAPPWKELSLSIVLACAVSHTNVVCGTEPKEATEATKKANASVLDQLPFADRADFEDARRGLIDEGPATIRDARGHVVWDLEQYAFLKDGARPPETVNPSLWRLAQLNLIRGLFQVSERVYQVRGYDLSNISFVVGETGYIVIDPLVSAETARAAIELLYKNVGKKPVVAVIYSHSHVDHFGGVKGIVTDEDVRTGRVRIIAPVGFLEHAVSENVTAGNVMSRRAMYMYGSLLPRSPRGHVDAGIGKSISHGRVTLLAPTDFVGATGKEMTIDGVQIVFQFTPGAEAQTEMNFYLPQFKALCVADNCIHALHNLYSLRGTEVRDGKAWSQFLNETADLFGDKAEVMFAGHTWPCWGNARVVDMLKKQRDAYKYIHDQTLRLANHGYSMVDIAGMLKLPDPLAREWYNRGYYGTVSHNAKAVYQKYIGWFDGNPAHLDPLPPVEAGKRYVEFMGGSAAVLEKARAAYARGEYRWVAEVVNHVVFAEPDNLAARELQADALEQLGYQAESASWRNCYLSGASDLRNGMSRAAAPNSRNSDVAEALRVDMLFDYLAVHLNGPRAGGRTLKFNWKFTDTDERYILTLENSALTYLAGKQAADADATVITSRSAFIAIVLGRTNVVASLAAGALVIQGDVRKLVELLSLLDEFDLWFNLVTPRRYK